MKWASTLVLPILVLADKTLWVADHTAEGVANSKPRQVDECSIYLDATITTMGTYCELSYPISHLLVFTKTGFSDFLWRFRNRKAVRDQLLPDTSEIASAAEFLK